MIETGRVARTYKDIAVVCFKRRAACDKCRRCAVTPGGTEVALAVRNTLELNAGDFVAVETGEPVATKNALIYLVPLALTALGAGLGTLMSIGASAVFAAVGLAAGLAIAIPIDLAVFRKRERPRMIEVKAPDDAQN